MPGTSTRAQRPHPPRRTPPPPPAAVDFQYRDPERGFDRSRVKGVVAKLVRVQDPATSTALEVAAGGKLYQARSSRWPCCCGGKHTCSRGGACLSTC